MTAFSNSKYLAPVVFSIFIYSINLLLGSQFPVIRTTPYLHCTKCPPHPSLDMLPPTPLGHLGPYFVPGFLPTWMSSWPPPLLPHPWAPGKGRGGWDRRRPREGKEERKKGKGREKERRVIVWILTVTLLGNGGWCYSPFKVEGVVSCPEFHVQCRGELGVTPRSFESSSLMSTSYSPCSRGLPRTYRDSKKWKLLHRLKYVSKKYNCNDKNVPWLPSHRRSSRSLKTP